MVTRTLEAYLGLGYVFEVISVEDSDSFVRYSKLPNCLAQVEEHEDIRKVRHDVVNEWLSLKLEDSSDILMPRRPGAPR